MNPNKTIFQSINESLFAVYEASNKPKFSVGDKVKIKLSNNKFDGKTGKIAKVMGNKTFKYKVQIDNEKIGPLTYLESELSAV